MWICIHMQVTKVMGSRSLPWARWGEEHAVSRSVYVEGFMMCGGQG